MDNRNESLDLAAISHQVPPIPPKDLIGGTGPSLGFFWVEHFGQQLMVNSPSRHL